MSFDRVVLLQETERRWLPVADACLGPSAVVGRGGLELEITEGRLLGPDVLAMLERPGNLPVVPGALARAGPPGAVQSGDPGQVVLTGRREGAVIGVAVAWAEPGPGGPAHVLVMVDEASRRQGAGRALLLALEAGLRRRGWATGRAWGHGPAAFFAACCAWGSRFEPAG